MSVLTCISLAASGDLEGLEIWSLAGADLTKPGYDGQTAIQVVGIRGAIPSATPTGRFVEFPSVASQAQAVGKPEVVDLLVQLLSNKSKVASFLNRQFSDTERLNCG